MKRTSLEAQRAALASRKACNRAIEAAIAAIPEQGPDESEDAYLVRRQREARRIMGLPPAPLPDYL